MTENPLLLKIVSLIIRSPSSIHCYLESTNVEECQTLMVRSRNESSKDQFCIDPRNKQKVLEANNFPNE